MAKNRKTGKPKELEEEERPTPPEPTLEQFIQNLHGESPPHPLGMPSVEWLKEQFDTKSAAIRYLVSEQCMQDLNRTTPFEVKDIAKHLGLRYQHVRNVASSPLKRGPNEDWRPKQKPPTV